MASSRDHRHITLQRRWDKRMVHRDLLIRKKSGTESVIVKVACYTNGRCTPLFAKKLVERVAHGPVSPTRELDDEVIQVDPVHVIGCSGGRLFWDPVRRSQRR